MPVLSRLVGAGLLQANSVALITQAFPAKERGKAIGIQGAVQAISMSVGPFVGGILIATVGWRAIFYVNIPIGILGTLPPSSYFRRTRKSKEKQKIDYLGTAFFASGLGSDRAGLQRGSKARLGLAYHNDVFRLRHSAPVPFRCYGAEGRVPADRPQAI